MAQWCSQPKQGVQLEHLCTIGTQGRAQSYGLHLSLTVDYQSTFEFAVSEQAKQQGPVKHDIVIGVR